MNRALRKIIDRFGIDPIGVAMPGPRLPRRVRTIIEDRSYARISRAHVGCLIGMFAAICIAFVAVTLTRAQSSGTLAWERAAGGKMSFDVASVKQNKSGLPPSGEIPHSNFALDYTDKYASTGGLFSVTNYPLIAYIAFAYKLPTTNELAKAPAWLSKQFFDVQARGPAGATKDQMRLMMQSLLADRFKMAAHWETQKGSVLILSLAKTGKLGSDLRPFSGRPPCAPEPTAHTPMSVQLQTVDDGLPAVCGRLIGSGGAAGANLAARNMTTAALARYISTDMMTGFNRNVIDEAGLSGGYDFRLTYRVEPSAGRPQPGDFQAAFIEALRDQLGLKLQPATGPIERLVIDHIEEPAPN